MSEDFLIAANNETAKMPNESDGVKAERDAALAQVERLKAEVGWKQQEIYSLMQQLSDAQWNAQKARDGNSEYFAAKCNAEAEVARLKIELADCACIINRLASPVEEMT